MNYETVPHDLNLNRLLLNRQLWGGGGGGNHNFVVIAPMIVKFVTSLPLRNYDVITCILADA